MESVTNHGYLEAWPKFGLGTTKKTVVGQSRTQTRDHQSKNQTHWLLVLKMVWPWHKKIPHDTHFYFTHYERALFQCCYTVLLIKYNYKNFSIFILYKTRSDSTWLRLQEAHDRWRCYMKLLNFHLEFLPGTWPRHTLLESPNWSWYWSKHAPCNTPVTDSTHAVKKSNSWKWPSVKAVS